MRSLFAITLLMLQVWATLAWDNDDCMSRPPKTAGCINVRNDWTKFRSAVNSAKDGAYLVFCPFRINDKQGEAAKPTARAAFVCQKEGECVIRGDEQHIIVNHRRAETLFWGFVFANTSESAFHIRDDSKRPQMICNCDFRDNHFTHRGSAIRAERDTTVVVSHCSFSDNTAARGGAVYNRGTMFVSFSTFSGNQAEQGGALSFASYGTLTVKGNSFVDNEAESGGAAIFGRVSDSDLAHRYIDAGYNIVTGASCNGLLNRVGNTDTCHEFSTVKDTMPPTMSPSSTPTTHPTGFPSYQPSPGPTLSEAPTSPTELPSDFPSPRPSISPTSPTSSPSSRPSMTPSTSPSQTSIPSSSPSFSPSKSYTEPLDPMDEVLPLVARNQPPGYYNFNLDDPDFGPDAWWKVDISNNEFIRYAESGLDVLINECDEDEQSPIDLHYINDDCDEFHQIRARGGDWRNLTKEGEISFHILPSHLRIQIDSNNPKGPRADSPGGFTQLYADHVEITTPSLHTFNGHRFDGEYTIYHVQGTLNRVLLVSVVIDASENEYNDEFQKVLNAFWQVDGCGLAHGRKMQESDLADDIKDNIFRRMKKIQQPRNQQEEIKLAEQAKISGKFNIYNIDMVPSIYWYAYRGSLPRPPCSRLANWRVMDVPMKISHLQLQQLKQLQQDGPCCNNVGLGEVRARTIQQDCGRDVWKCTPNDYKSDCERFGRICPAPEYPPP